MRQSLISFITLFCSSLFSLLSLSLPAAEITYPNGAKKAVIFSFDDAPVQDKKLVELFNKYKLVGTFNINSGLLGKQAPWMKNLIGQVGQYLTLEQITQVYKGHEIAGHSYSHPGLAGLEKTELAKQLRLDQQILSPIKGSKLTSFAYPLGSYDQAAIEALAVAGFTNARTVEDTLTFNLPSQPLAWHPTVHHSKAMPLIEEYVSLKPTQLTVLLIWGHSWEFDYNKPDNSWQYIEQLLQKVSGKEDIWYVSAGEFIKFIGK